MAAMGTDRLALITTIGYNRLSAAMNDLAMTSFLAMTSNDWPSADLLAMIDSDLWMAMIGTDWGYRQ